MKINPSEPPLLGDTFQQTASSAGCNQWTSVTSSSINSGFTRVCVFNACGSNGVYCPEKRSFSGRIVIPRYTTTTVLDTSSSTLLCLPSPTTQVNIPTYKPTQSPTVSLAPTKRPTSVPSRRPSPEPSKRPTAEPSKRPTSEPTKCPSNQPTPYPTHLRTSNPTSEQTNSPSSESTVNPTALTSEQPTYVPTSQPSNSPTLSGTNSPTSKPTANPTLAPRSNPTCEYGTQYTCLYGYSSLVTTQPLGATVTLSCDFVLASNYDMYLLITGVKYEAPIKDEYPHYSLEIKFTPTNAGRYDYQCVVGNYPVGSSQNGAAGSYIIFV